MAEQKKRLVLRRPKAGIVAEQERSKARLERQERINRENRERERAALKLQVRQTSWWQFKR
jgi:hypothetical protein